MDHNNPERLSALVDGELSDAELERAAGHLAENQVLHTTWQRYHLIGDVLRDDISESLHGLQVAARVRESLASEPVVLAPRRRAATAWKPVAGFAIAATVATIAVISVQPGQVSDAGTPVIATTVSATATPVVSPTPAPVVFPPELLADRSADTTEADIGAVDTLANQRLNSYLVNFNEQRASTGMPGVNPHVRTVGFDGSR
ncbi:MAG: sigma-E factor negative regulatory protein [Gammaproteobacteria bacterium]|nr:sigma-E factor negative regulatory protein [Gammaproteobacteria bacterium]NNL99244.1 sigma-E factor negative regulatory protein [Gammaproteobacteria bacterium]